MTIRHFNFPLIFVLHTGCVDQMLLSSQFIISARYVKQDHFEPYARIRRSFAPTTFACKFVASVRNRRRMLVEY